MRNAPLIALVLVSLILGAGTLTRGHQWGDDFSWYILQAKSIVDGTPGELVKISAFTNYQSTQHLGPLLYPWGYPLILVPFYALKGISPLALKLPALIFYAGFLICLYFLVSDRLRKTESLLLVALFAFNPLLLDFLDQILSDIPFLFFSTLSLLLMTRSGNGMAHYAFLGAAIFFTAFMRFTGILLLGSFLLVEFFRLLENRADRPAVVNIIKRSLVICLVFVLLWVMNLLLFPSGGESYLSQYGDLLQTARDLAGTYFYLFAAFFGSTPGWIVLYRFLVPFFLVGAWVQRKQEPVFLLYFVFWMIVHVTYPWRQGPRYIFPLLPIFVYLTFQGMRAVIHRLPARHHILGHRVFYGFWLIIAALFLWTSTRYAYNNLMNNRQINGPFDPYSTEVYTYIKEETPPESVVIFFKPRVMVMMTGHPSIMSTECDRMLKGDYLVLNRKVGENQQIPPERIDSCQLPLNQVLQNNRFLVYQILK